MSDTTPCLKQCRHLACRMVREAHAERDKYHGAAELFLERLLVAERERDERTVERDAALARVAELEAELEE